ncbi:MAG: hypothetical protein GX878_02260 [Firmicutes bacterium]|nr:hypothetical protein [Bacillota bacterium]
MKRVLALVALVLVISISLVAGTLAMYVVTIDDLAEGSVVAKEFILLKGGTNTFEENVKIAPGETVAWKFSVKNYNDNAMSETDMELKFMIDVAAAAGKEHIKPLWVEVKDSSGNSIGKLQYETMTFGGDQFTANKKEEIVYFVSIHWPSDDQVDIDFAGSNYGTAIKVSVTGTQLP